MKKILVPVDFSEDTPNTINVACNFATEHHCGIILLHSYFYMALAQSINTLNPDDFMPIAAPDVTLLKETSGNEMDILTKGILDKHPSLHIETEITGLDLKEIIIEICSRNDILMVVIGATGTGKKESFSGSAASLLFECSPVPVFAIPESFKYEASNCRNVLYATSFAEAAQTEVRFILEYFVGSANSLLCRHLRFPENDSLLDNAQMDILSKPFGKEIKEGRVSFEIVDANDTEEALSNLVERNGIGLISFHEHNRGIFYRFFHKSVVKKDIYRFNIPLLVFRKFENP